MEIEASFTPIIPNQGLVGFASARIDNWLELGSMGVYCRADGQGFRLTFPGKKLPNGILKHYFRIVDAEIETEIRKAVEKEIERLGVYKVKAISEEQ